MQGVKPGLCEALHGTVTKITPSLHQVGQVITLFRDLTFDRNIPGRGGRDKKTIYTQYYCYRCVYPFQS